MKKKLLERIAFVSERLETLDNKSINETLTNEQLIKVNAQWDVYYKEKEFLKDLLGL